MLLTSQWIVKMNFWASMNAGMRGNMKRKIAWILLAAMTLSIAACGNKTGDSVADDGNITAEATEGALDTSANLEGSCADILDEIYKTAKTDDDYFSYTDDFENVEITEAEEEYILGTTEIDYTDSVYSAPMMSSIAYQCVLLRVSEDQDIEAAKKLLEENADPAKWICVEAESVVVENVGDVILFIMADKDVADPDFVCVCGNCDLPALLCVLYRIADQVRPHFLKCIPAHKQHAVFRDTVCHL
jgi:hypothetical protein